MVYAPVRNDGLLFGWAATSFSFSRFGSYQAKSESRGSLSSIHLYVPNAPPRDGYQS
jgi:hypothetical protein